MLKHSGGDNVINISSTMSRPDMVSPPTALPKPRFRTTLDQQPLDPCPCIRVNAISPRSILTSSLDALTFNETLRTPMEQVAWMRHSEDPVDIAIVSVYLMSFTGRHLTGKTLKVDEGLIFPNLDLTNPDPVNSDR